MLLKEYFQDTELWCPCCYKLPPKESVIKLYIVRLMYGKPIIVLSGYRCKEYNRSPHLGSNDDSYHPKGKAFDVIVPNSDRRLLMHYAFLAGFNGFGLNDNSLHIDLRDNITYWGYK